MFNMIAQAEMHAHEQTQTHTKITNQLEQKKSERWKRQLSIQLVKKKEKKPSKEGKRKNLQINLQPAQHLTV